MNARRRRLQDFPLRIARAVTLRVRSWRALMTARRDSERRLQATRVRRLLVICYGNIYRSAFVGEWLRTHVDPSIEVRSAGFHPVAGRPSPLRHVEQCRTHGVELAAHRSCIVTTADLAWADVIVLMDRHNWWALRTMGAEEEKLVWLGALARGGVEINDPYRMDDEHAGRTVERLREAAEALCARLRSATG